MTRPSGSTEPDPDLVEYVVISAPSLADLDPIAGATADLVRSGHIRLFDAVVLVRPDQEPAVPVVDPARHPVLAGLCAHALADGIRLSPHDIELTAVTLAPGVAALMLLLEDGWAKALATTAREVGGRLTGGERIPRERVVGQIGAAGPVDARSVHGDLLARSPLNASPTVGPTSPIDPAAQVRELVQLVERGLLSLDQYEAQRRRVLDG
jgi:hypothetical protein